MRGEKYLSRLEEKAKTKEKIVSAATTLFFQNGYDNTTMHDIMSFTKLSKGAVYHHFKSKQEILDYIIIQKQNYIKEMLIILVNNKNLCALEKIEYLINIFHTDKSFPELTRNNWAEKIPYALLHTLRINLNVLSRYIEEIINQGNINHEFDCRYPKEISELFILLFDIWLDPVIVNGTYEEACSRADFIILLLNKFNTPLINSETQKFMKERMKTYYDK